MVNKTQKEDLGPRLPEKKKKKKKKKKVANVSEPETQYSVLNNNDYFIDVSPPRATSPFNNVGEVQVPEMSLGKRKKKKKSCSTHLDEYLSKDEPTWTRQIKSPSPRRQVLEQSAEGLIREKKKKRRKSVSKAASQGSGLKISPDSKHAKEVSKAGRKPKKHRKEKKLPDTEAFPPQDSWIHEAGDALHSCLEGTEAEEQAALGHKRKQGSPRDHSMKKKKKKKTHQEGDLLLVNSKISMENSLKKGSKKSVRSEALDFIPIDSLKAPGKKKVKSKKKVEQPVGDGLAVKRKKKKRRKDSGVKEDPWQEEKEESDTDLEVVLEKKGNMDETCIDQVRRKALQEEIDRESGKTEVSEPKKWTGTQFGQWDTAGFENEEQKLKFLKLMGGFKHLSPSFNRPPSMTVRSNMALDKKSSDMLQQSLQQDYDRAMSWKYSRGAGLGFNSEAPKVFYIDRNASKSIKLQD